VSAPDQKLRASIVEAVRRRLMPISDIRTSNRYPHVQQRSPGVIFRLEVVGLSTGPCNAFANCDDV
jgi:hypothetical protein